MELFKYSSPLFEVQHTLTPHPDPDIFHMHAHDRLELYMLIQGKVSFGIEGGEQPLNPYDIVITREAETHKLTVDSGSPYERIWIQFHKELIADVDPHFELLRPFYDRPLGKGNLYRQNMKSDRFWHDCIIKLHHTDNNFNYKTHLLCCLLPILRDLTLRMDNNITIENSGSADLSTKLVAYINDHLFEPLSLEDLSKEFYISKSQLNRVFRNATGSTVAHYISIKRLLTARSQIRNGAPIHLVAQQCGFGDYSTFYRAYKKQFNIAPIDDKNPIEITE